MRAALAATMVCFVSSWVHSAGAIEDKTPRAEAIKANFAKLVSEDKEVKREALLYFGKVDKTFAAEVPLFTASLKDERNQVRAISAYALGKIGEAAAGAIPAVEKLLTDSSASVQKYAKRALERLKSSRLTAEEAAKVLAYWIGEWELKSHDGETIKVVYRWKDKGKSIEGTFINVQEFDPVSGGFIFRFSKGLTEHYRYDPATRFYYPVPFNTRKALQIKDPGSIVLLSKGAVVDGELKYSLYGELKRVKASPQKPVATQPTPPEVIDAIKKLGGRIAEDKNKVVVSVDLSGTNDTDAGLVHLNLYESLGLTNLMVLLLSGTELTDAGMVHLKGMTKLATLHLSGTKVTDAGLAHLKGLTNLEELYLEGTKVTDAGLMHLKGLTKLQILGLRGTDVTDAGLKHLKGLMKLQVLFIDSTKVTDAGLVHLEGLTKLEWLHLKGTKVTDAGLKKLQQALPNCMIFH